MRRSKRRRVVSAILAFMLLVGSMPLYASANTSSLPAYLDRTKSVDERVSDLLGRMTVDEKIGQMIQAERASVTSAEVKQYYLGSVLSGGGSFPGGNQKNSTREQWTSMYDNYQDGALSTRLGIPLLYGVDAVHGHNNVVGATIFPHNIGLGAAANEELTEKIGEAVAKEVRATGINWTFAPTIANPQDIRWGRTYEGFSEDAELVSKLGVAMIRGLQGTNAAQWKQRDKVAATAKHFIGEGHTTNGANKGDVALPEAEVLARDLQMYKDAVDAGVKSVMVSYNSINNLRMHANGNLIQDVLKGAVEDGGLGFTGFVITDYNGIDDIAIDQDGNAVTDLKGRLRTAVNAGIDMFMQPSNWKQCIGLLKELVAEEAISMERLDDAAGRILKVKFEMGVFEAPQSSASLAASFGSAEHRQLARQAVAESLVLLKNDEVNGTPVLSQLADMDSIFVAGRGADDIGMQSGGWTVTWQGGLGDVTTGTSIIDGIREVAGTGKKITYDKNGRGANGHDVAIVVIGENPYAESDGDNLNGLKLTNQDLYTLENVKASGVPTIVILLSGRPMLIDEQIADADGFIAAWLPGTEGAGVADVLFGTQDFSGKLPISWPYYTEAYAQQNRDAYMMFAYGDGLTKSQATPEIPAKPELPAAPAPTIPDDADVVAIPAKIEAEHYYAVSSGINTEATSDEGGGLNIGWTSNGSWLDYYIEVEEAGVYDFNFRYAGNGGGAMVTVGNEVKGQTSLAGTGGWQNWRTSALQQVSLAPGQHKVRITLPNGGLNINWFEIVKTQYVEPQPPQLEPQTSVKENWVKVWMTNEREPGNTKWYWAPQYEDGDMKLEQQSNRDLAYYEQSDMTTIHIDPEKKYQEMMGIGTSMEESTVYNSMKMSDSVRNQLLQDLVDPVNGIGLSLIRVTIGTSDFTAGEFYSYDDMPPGQTDEDLSEFSIQRDIDLGIIDNLKKLKQTNPDLQFFASPWSPPGWMKTTDSLIRGQVKPEYEALIAKYYLKFIQAYEAQGIPISAMTMQNEPLLEIDYPSVYMSWEQQARIAKLLRKELDENGYEHILLWTFDHNPGDTMAYPAKILQDNVTGAADALDGTAFHDYGGDLGLMSQLKELYPHKNVYLTERAVWGTQGADRMAQYFRNWAKSYNSWVLMLDSNIATHHWVGTPDPTPIIQDAANPDQYWKAPEYYLLGQYAKFVRPGYFRIDSDYGSSSTVTNVSFMSPDEQKIVSVVINQTKEDQPFKLVIDGMQIQDILPAGTVATYQWDRLIAQHQAPGSVAAIQFDEASGTYQTEADHIGYLNGEASFSYLVDVQEAGSYYVDVEFASDDSTGAAEQSTVTLLQDGQVVAGTQPLAHKTWGWSNWNGKRLIAELDAGLHTITLAFNGKDVNLHGLVFTKKPAEIAVPGKIEAEQFTTADAVLVQNNRTTVGFWDDGEQLGYTINVREAGTYPLAIRYASGSANPAVKVTANGVEQSYSLTTTTDWEAWNVAYDSITLEAGLQTIQLTAVEGLNLDWVAIGASLEASASLSEMELDGAQIEVKLVNEQFAAELDAAAWSVSGVEGIEVAQVVPGNDLQSAIVTLGGVRQRDFDSDTALSLQVAGSQLASAPASGLTAVLPVAALNDTEQLAVAQGGLDYGVAGDTVTLQIAGGTFNEENINQLTVAGTAVTQGGVTLAGVQYDSATQLTLTLAWNETPYYSDLQLNVNVPAAAYSDSRGQAALTASVLLQGTSKLDSYHAVPAQLDATAYYKRNGAIEAAEGGNAILDQLTSGSWVDYRIDVAEAGKYTVELKFNYAAGGNIQLQNGAGEVLGTFAVPSNGNSWSGMRTTIELEQGEQTLRLYVSSGSLKLDWVAIEQPLLHAEADGKIQLPAVKYDRGTSHIIQYDSNGNQYNTGYAVAGTWLDFTVDVPEAGQYMVTTNYATQQGGVSVDFVVNEAVVGSAALPATGSWSSYQNAAGIVALEAGVQSIRIYDRGDGANFHSFTLERYDGEIIAGQVEKPQFSNEPGSYTGSVTIAMSSATQGASIYYTTDGSYPTTESILYSTPITLYGDQYIRAIAVRTGMDDSFITQGQYVITSGSGSGEGGTGTPPVKPEEPGKPDASEIQLVDKLTVKDGIVAVEVQSGKSQVHLPLDSSSWKDVKQVVVKQGKQTVTLSLALLEQLLKASSGQGKLVVDVKAASGQAANTSLQNAQALSGAKLTAFSTIGMVQVSLLDKSGSKQQVTAPEDAVQVSYAISGETNVQLLGIYRIEASGELTYAGGVLENGSISTALSQWGSYVVLQYVKEFADLSAQHWAHDVIGQLAAKQIVKGVNATQFAPDQSVTRAEFVALIARALQLPAGEQAPFADVKQGQWFADSVAAAYGAGLISGKSASSFAPQATITREEMAIIIVKAYEYKFGKPQAGEAAEHAGFNDAEHISKWAAEAVQRAGELGIMQGRGEGNFVPQGLVTRAESAQVISKLFE